jgi:hypothetical protein
VGKIEKYVVLTVLFVVALILGVSLNAPEGVAAAEPSEELAAVETEAAAEPARPPIQRGGPGDHKRVRIVRRRDALQASMRLIRRERQEEGRDGGLADLQPKVFNDTNDDPWTVRSCHCLAKHAVRRSRPDDRYRGLVDHRDHCLLLKLVRRKRPARQDAGA